MRLEYIASCPVWLRSPSYDTYLVCAYVSSRDYSTRCIAFADAFSPILETRVDVTAPLCSATTSCKGRVISDAVVTTRGPIELWRAGPHLVVLQGDTLHSLNTWLTSLERAALLVKRLEYLGTRVPRIICGDFFDIVAQLINAPSAKRTRGSIPWQADVKLDFSLFSIHAPHHVDTRPGYLIGHLPHRAPVEASMLIEDIEEVALPNLSI